MPALAKNCKNYACVYFDLRLEYSDRLVLMLAGIRDSGSHNMQRPPLSKIFYHRPGAPIFAKVQGVI